MTRKFTRAVETPAEYREMVAAAEAMDIELVKAIAVGTWETADGETAWPSNSEIVDDHHTYFSMDLDGTLTKAQPSDSAFGDNDGRVLMAFRP